MTPAGFPHSEIFGSKLGKQLPEAFRSYPRPSSPPSAKASTICPYLLDQISPRTRMFHPLAGHPLSELRSRPHAQNAISIGHRKTIRLSKTADPAHGSAPACLGPAALEGRRKIQKTVGGADRDRTDDLRLAKPALSQLSYSPKFGGLARGRGPAARTAGLWPALGCPSPAP